MKSVLVFLACLILVTIKCDRVQQKIMMTDKGLQHDGAVCIDGTDAGFWLTPSGDDANKNNWVMYFEGGGWCYSEQDCFNRSNTDLGSSKNWPATVGAGGPMDDNCTKNPDFCNYNKVYIKYCDGNSFSGNRQDAMVVNGKKLYFRGHQILNAVLDTLKRDHNLVSAENFILTGCSAGGLATYLHADYVHNYLDNNTTKKVKYGVLPISGFFIDVPNVDQEEVYRQQIINIFWMSHATEGLNSDCIAARHEEEHWKCNFAEYTYEHIKSRIFALNSALDSWQTGCIFTPNFDGCGCAGKGTWNACSADPEKCTNDQTHTMNTYMQSFMQRMQQYATYNKTGNGSFIHSCHTHCEAQSDAYNSFAVNGVTMQKAVSKWWNNESNPATQNNYSPCYYKENGKPRECNPTCGSNGFKTFMMSIIG